MQEIIEKLKAVSAERGDLADDLLPLEVAAARAGLGGLADQIATAEEALRGWRLRYDEIAADVDDRNDEARRLIAEVRELVALASVQIAEARQRNREFAAQRAPRDPEHVARQRELKRLATHCDGGATRRPRTRESRRSAPGRHRGSRRTAGSRAGPDDPDLGDEPAGHSPRDGGSA